jgi:hypothetical protein
MSHTQFLDESEFSLKIGGIEIDPTTGDGIEGLLKFDSWTLQRVDGHLAFMYDGIEKFRISSVDGASSITASFNEYEYTATANQTTFSGADENSNTLSYNLDKVVVFMNGVRLLSDTDFTANTGNSIVFAESLNAGDIIAIQSF